MYNKFKFAFIFKHSIFNFQFSTPSLTPCKIKRKEPTSRQLCFEVLLKLNWFLRELKLPSFVFLRF